MFTIQPLSQWDIPDESLIVGMFKGNRKQQTFYSKLNEQMDNMLEHYVQEGDIRDDAQKVTVIHTLNQINPKRLYIVGLGHRKQLDLQTLRKVFGTVFKKIQEDERESVSIVLESFVPDHLSEKVAAEVLAEAKQMATYIFPHYKTGNEQSKKRIDRIRVLVSEDERDIQNAITVGQAFGIGANTARQLVHMPGNLLNATELANFSRKLAEKYGFDIEILEKEDMERLGMGALLAVNQGSVEPPK